MILVWLFILVFIMFILWFSHRYAWWKAAVSWDRPRVLMYHMVREHIPGAKFNKLRVTPQAFEKQIAWLHQQGFNFVTMQELQDHWNSLPEKTLAITFDDGYADNLIHALPVLQKYNAKATIYVVVDRHERDWSSYKKAHHNSGELAKEPKLTDAQLKQLVDSGLIEIGSHTLTHMNMATASIEAKQQELMQSRQQLQALTGQAVNSFAYPFGIYAQQDVALVKQAGYSNAVTTLEGIDPISPTPDFLQLQRIKVSGKDNLMAFICRIKTGKRGL